MKKNSSFIWPVLFLLFWLILCEKLNAEVFMIGIVISAAVYYFNRNLLPTGNFRIRKLPLYALYLLLLLKEIILANISVAGIVLSPKMNVSPCIVRLKTQLKSKLHRAILANSITLTPGTLTVQFIEDELIVHCLVKAYIPGLIHSKFEKLLLKIEG
ncbi:MAG: sodium:proton antiporter [Clostridia bacterium]|nr:sodium:proton antiporter [Clostridia bacterium]